MTPTEKTRYLEAAALDSIHNTIAEIERHCATRKTVADQIVGLAISGDALTRHWTPIRTARLDAGAAIPSGHLWPTGLTVSIGVAS